MLANGNIDDWKRLEMGKDDLYWPLYFRQIFPAVVLVNYKMQCVKKHTMKNSNQILNK